MSSSHKTPKSASTSDLKDSSSSSVVEKTKVREELSNPNKSGKDSGDEKVTSSLSSTATTITQFEQNPSQTSSDSTETQVQEFFSLGYQQFYGDERKGIPSNFIVGLPMIKKVAEYNIKEALNHLGRAYIFAYGVPHDPDQALTCFKKSMELGYEPAKNNYQKLLKAIKASKEKNSDEKENEDPFVSFKEFILEAELGRGEYGKVFKAHWNSPEFSKPMVVALKRMAHYESSLALGETKIMEKLKDLDCVIKFFGVSKSLLRKNRDNYYIIMEYASKGDLEGLLQNPQTNLSLDDWYNLVIEIASAIALIHQRGIRHDDLSAKNFLIGENGRIKISDFGASIEDKDGSRDIERFGIIIGEIIKKVKKPLNEDSKKIQVLEFLQTQCAQSDKSLRPKSIDLILEVLRHEDPNRLSSTMSSQTVVNRSMS